MFLRLILTGLLFAASFGNVSCRCSEAPSRSPPRLVVLLVIDQLRGDELEKHERLFRYGLRRLLDEGRTYSRAMHGHASTETATGHATIATGLYPRYHGVVGKWIYDRSRGEALEVCRFGTGPCDPDVILEPTLGDRLKQKYPGAKVVALSHKRRSAMLLGGRQADLVAWGVPFDEDPDAAMAGRQADGFPIPQWLRLFRQQVATPERINRIWELPRLPPPYSDWRDDAPSEIDDGDGITFPHHLPDTDDLQRLYWSWFCTPDNDRALVDTAVSVAKRLELGHDDIPDLLAISLSGFDAIGHNFGPDSLERVAALTELDRHLGDLLNSLAELAGSRLVVGLTSDHGIAPTPWAAAEQGHTGERVDPEKLAAVARAALNAQLGPGDYLQAVVFPFITLKNVPPSGRPAALAAVSAALTALPAVHGVWATEALSTPRSELEELLAANLYPGRSGDLVVVLEPYSAPWQKYRGDDGAEHGSPWAYDRHVPLILWGDGVTAGRIDDEVGVIDLTRTLGDRLRLPVDPRGGSPLP